MLALILYGYPVAFVLTTSVWWVLSRVGTARPYNAKAAAAIALAVLLVLPAAAFLMLTREDVDLSGHNTEVSLKPPSPSPTPLPSQSLSEADFSCVPGQVCTDNAKSAPYLNFPRWTRNRKPRWAADGPAAPRANDEYLQTLPQGSAVVVAPQHAMEYQPFDVSLRVSVKTLQDLLKEISTAAAPAMETAGVTNVRLSQTMSAELVTADCTIEGSATAQWTQAVTESEATVWPWRVHCDTAGVKQIAVRLNTLLKIDGVETPKIIAVAELPIEVHVDSLAWAARHYKWITTTIVIPLLAWFTQRFFRNRQRKAAESIA